MGQVAGNCHYIFQKDRGPAHNKKRMQDWLQESLTEVFEKEMWPPSSTDWDSFVWISLGVSGLRANLKPCNKTENLVPKIKEVMRSLDRNTMAKACMRSRMEAVFTADGSFIEYVDCQYVSLLIFFYVNKIGWFSAVLCHLKERRKKFRIYRCHPVYLNINIGRISVADPDPGSGVFWSLDPRWKKFQIRDPGMNIPNLIFENFL